MRVTAWVAALEPANSFEVASVRVSIGYSMPPYRKRNRAGERLTGIEPGVRPTRAATLELPPISTALADQLGLKLEVARARGRSGCGPHQDAH